MNYIVLDTETTNTLDDPIAYDIGWAVVNENGEVLTTSSFVVAEVFLDRELMSFAYFADKIPQYWEEIKSGKRQLKRLFNIRRALIADCIKYETNIIVAHNARFDYKSTATTQRYITCSKYRYFLPYGVEVWDTLKMSKKVLSENAEYLNFCGENDYLCKNGKPRFTAEIIYRFLTNDNDFIESHTGLEDVLIEKEILKYCLENCPNINGKLWA